MKGKIVATSIMVYALILSACDAYKKDTPEYASANTIEAIFKADDAEILHYLSIKEHYEKIELPFCETKNCIDINIQTVQTKDSWLNNWIATSQAQVIQDQIGLKQNMSLQQAINAYVKKSDAWQAEFSK